MTTLRTNFAAMTALSTLKAIGRDLDTSAQRVATGRRVAEAADNAAYWSIATSIRTDKAVLSAIKDSLGLGAAAVDTAYRGLTSVLSDLQNLRAKLQSALQPGVDRAKVQVEIAAIQARMRATAQTSVSGGQNWLAIDSARDPRPTHSVISGSARGDGGMSRIDIDVAGLALYDAATHSVAKAGTTAKVTGSEALPAVTNFRDAGTSFTIAVDGQPARTVRLDAGTLASAVPDLSAVTPDQIVAAINNTMAADPALAGMVRADLDAAGRLTFETTATGETHRLDITSTGSGAGANLVTNGDFESPLTTWTWSDSNIGLAPRPHGGSQSLIMGTVNTLGEIRTLVPTVAGQSYTLKFWLAKDADPDLENRFAAVWDTTPVYTLGPDPSGFPYGAHEFTVTANGPFTLLTFQAQHKPAFWAIDDVSVTALGGTSGPTLGFGTSATGRGTSETLGAGRGLLDTVDGATGFSIDSIEISALVGSAGDTALGTMITQVETVIARTTTAGTQLGASRTQITGQSSFVDALMKVNDRTLGILVDAEIEEESTRLKALSTQQQLAAQSLSIANAASGNLLVLFR